VATILRSNDSATTGPPISTRTAERTFVRRGVLARKEPHRCATAKIGQQEIQTETLPYRGEDWAERGEGLDGRSGATAAGIIIAPTLADFGLDIRFVLLFRSDTGFTAITP
jgi:hypothetical protein